MYKIHNNLSPFYLKQIFSNISTVHTHSLRNSESNYFIRRRRTDYTKGILHYRGSRHLPSASLISRVKYWTNNWAETCFHLCQWENGNTVQVCWWIMWLADVSSYRFWLRFSFLGRWSRGDLRPWIRFNHVVRQVTFNDSSDDFSVVAKNLEENKDLPVQKFDYVIVATGHFSVPNVPSFPGIDQFPGRIIHSHDFRNASQFKDQTLLVVGSSYSAEDIALQTLKYGAKKIVTSYKTRPMGFKWPPQITEKPLLTKIEGSTVHFKDGSKDDVDAIILCTGYLFSFPFLEGRLRLKTGNILFPAGLYKSIVWTQAGNNKLLYIGMQDQYYSYTMFDAQAKWAVNYITGELKLPDNEAMEKDCKKWTAK